MIRDSASRNHQLVAVADRSPILVRGLAGYLTDVGYETLTATTSAEVRDLLGKSPDLVLVDLRFLLQDESLWPTLQGLSVRVVVSASRDEAREIEPLLDQGLAGIWDRDSDSADLFRVVSGALSGSPFVSADVGGALIARMSSAGAALRDLRVGLTAREHEILLLMADGSGNRSIAEQLFISENTVRNHVRSILEKLHAQSRTEAVVRAARAGLIRLA